MFLRFLPTSPESVDVIADGNTLIAQLSTKQGEHTLITQQPLSLESLVAITVYMEGLRL